MAAYSFDSIDNLLEYIKNNVLTSKEAMEILGISKARLSKLVDDDKIRTLKSDTTHLFYKPDVEKKRIELEELRKKYRPYDS